MEERIARFIAALRASGVRVSLAESADAWRAISCLGVVEREAFRLSLRSTLVKDAADLPTFDELFAAYFGTGQPPMMNPQEGLNPEEQAMLQDLLQMLADELGHLLNWLFNGQSPTAEELQELAERAGMDGSDLPYAARTYARRMQRLLGWQDLAEILDLIWELLAAEGMDPQKIQQLQQRVGENMRALQQTLEQFAGQNMLDQRIEDAQQRRRSREDLLHRPFASLTEQERALLRDEVRRLAARLRSRAALRQRRGQVGKLDAKSTLRANLRYGGVPFDLRFKTRRLKPKLVSLLDVSTSMRPVSEFFLWMLYELQDQVQKARSYAFIDHLEDITTDLATRRPDDAMLQILFRLPPGSYNTDLGYSLRQFQAEHLGTVDSRTTLIVVGDARNNYNDPELEVFCDLGRRARRVIWLNPEYPAQWGSGDSDMLQYAPWCKEVYQVRNLAQLAEAIDRMLTA